jgi:hypothetical protein
MAVSILLFTRSSPFSLRTQSFTPTELGPVGAIGQSAARLELGLAGKKRAIEKLLLSAMLSGVSDTSYLDCTVGMFRFGYNNQSSKN